MGGYNTLRLWISFLILASVTTLYGAILPTDVKLELLDDFSGGLNTNDTSHKLLKNESPDMRNVVIDEDKSINVRNGFITVGSTNGLTAIPGMWPFERSNGTKELIATDNSRVIATSDFTTYRLLRSGLNPNVNVTCEQAKDKIVCSNGSDAPFVYDGSTVTVLDGSGGTPTMPRGKYLKYYQERMWALNDPNDNSGLYFSAVSSTDGVLINFDDSRAWPTNNKLAIGSGDGQVGTGMAVKDGILIAWKERSKYAIYGNSDETYAPKKLDSNIGVVSNDSIAQGDGLIYYLSQDGIYADSGGQSARISEKITPDVELIQKNNANIITNSWNAASGGNSDFLRGQVSYTTVSATSGEVTLYNSSKVANNSKDVSTILSEYNSNPVRTNPNFFFLNVPGTESGFGSQVTALPFDQTDYIFRQMIVNVQYEGGGADPIQSPCNANNTAVLSFTVMNLNTLQSATQTVALNSNDFTETDPRPHFQARTLDFGSNIRLTRAEIETGNIYVKTKLEYETAGFCTVLVAIPTVSAYSTMILSPVTTGQFVSDIATITTNNAWGSFNAEYTGVGADFFIRGATSIVNMATQTWTSISPGSVISLPTAYSYIQYASTLTGLNPNAVPSISNVSIDHIVGQGASNRAVGINWKNRYWLAVSTESTGASTRIYVKSKNTAPIKDAWMLFSGIPVRSMARFNNNLYGGAISSGVFYRLDYGTNDDGASTDWYYQTPNLILGDYFFQKDLMRLKLDSRSLDSSSTVSIGVSYDDNTFTDSTVFLNGTSRTVSTLPATQYHGKYFRFRFSNSQIDKRVNVNNFLILYKESQRD